MTEQTNFLIVFFSDNMCSGSNMHCLQDAYSTHFTIYFTMQTPMLYLLLFALLSVYTEISIISEKILL